MQVKNFLQKDWLLIVVFTVILAILTAIPNYFYHASADIDRPMAVSGPTRSNPFGVEPGTYAIDHPVHESTQIGFPLVWFSAHDGGFSGGERSFNLQSLFLDLLIHMPFGFGIVALIRGFQGRDHRRDHRHI